MRTDSRPPEISGAPPTSEHDDRFLMVSLSAAAVWVAIGVASLFTPDLVSGTEQDHVPITALTMWIWGAIATGFVVMTGTMGRGVVDGRWRGLGIAVGAIWAVVAIASIWTPELVTGTDPTRVPLPYTSVWKR